MDQPQSEHYMYLHLETIVDKWMVKSAVQRELERVLLSTEYGGEVGGSYSSALRPALTSAAPTYSLGHDCLPL